MKYLVIQLARFGDLIQTKRLILSLTAQGGEVHLCVDQSLVALAELVYPQCVVHGIAAHGSGMDELSARDAILVQNRLVFKAIQSERFDKVYNLNFSGLNFRLSTLFDPDSVVGYWMKNGQELISDWPQLAMRWSADRRIGLNLVDFWGWYADTPIPPEQVNPVATGKGGGIGVVLAGRQSRRSLPVESLASIIKTKYSKKNQQIYLLGTTSEAAAAHSLLRLLPPNILPHVSDMTGKTGWSDLVHIVSGLDGLLTPDTGTMHLAAHLGVPVEAYFLSSAWCFETGPYGLGHVVYQALTDCLPCLETQACPYDIKCRQPFYDTQFLRFISTGKSEHCPSGLIAFDPVFDSLGLSFMSVVGVDTDAQRREHFRSFVLDHVRKTGSTSVHSDYFEHALRFYQGQTVEID